MAYHRKTTLVRRRVPTTMGAVNEALGSFWDDVKGAASAAFGVVTAQSAAQAASNQAQKDLQAAVAAQNKGIDTTTLVVGAAAVGALALVLLRRKKKAS